MRTFINMPPQIAALPRDDNGWPIPYFVPCIDGKYDLRLADGRKQITASMNELCWVCGGELNGVYCFLGGPQSVANRCFSDWACHRDCAIFSAVNCPHLNNSKAKYREGGFPEGAVPITPNQAIKTHPGKVCVYVTRSWRPEPNGATILFRAGRSIEQLWFREGLAI